MHSDTSDTLRKAITQGRGIYSEEMQWQMRHIKRRNRSKKERSLSLLDEAENCERTYDRYVIDSRIINLWISM